MPARVEPWIEWLFSLHGPSVKWDIETMQGFAAALGHPERRVPALHVAGTNGKGSVAAAVHAIARASGLSAGLYTSPHLVRPEERIRVDDEDIGRAAFAALIERLRATASETDLPRHPSFFEMMTAAAFVAFADANVAVAVLETGLGGRLDATNVVAPSVTVITTVGLDHVKTLGGTLAAIAREKAGILKPGVPVVVGWMPPRAREVVLARASEVGAPVHRADDELEVRARRDGSFDLVTPVRVHRGLRTALAGPHQRRNAALAVRAVELLAERGVAFDLAAVGPGLASVRWPGRMETIVAGGVRFLLDGAHNPDGARALARALRERGGGPAVLVFGMSEGRRATELLAPLRPHVGAVLLAHAEIAKAIPPERIRAELAAAWPDLACECVPDVALALERAAAIAGRGGDALVAGSLYLVGDARRVLLGLEGTGHPLRETSIAPAGDSR